jgi:hypothetical protein
MHILSALWCKLHLVQPNVQTDGLNNEGASRAAISFGSRAAFLPSEVPLTSVLLHLAAQQNTRGFVFLEEHEGIFPISSVNI